MIRLNKIKCYFVVLRPKHLFIQNSNISGTCFAILSPPPFSIFFLFSCFQFHLADLLGMKEWWQEKKPHHSICNKLFVPHIQNILSFGNGWCSRLSKFNHQKQGRGKILFIQVRGRCVLVTTKNFQVMRIELVICWRTSNH